MSAAFRTARRGSGGPDAGVLDLRGLECPVPTVDAIAALQARAGVADEPLVVLLDDATCATDLPYQAARLGFEAYSEQSAAGEWRITLQRVPAEQP